MRSRKYQDIKVSSQVNVSSSSHYHFTVYLSQTTGYIKPRRLKEFYSFNVYNRIDTQFPKYVQHEVKAQMLELVKSGKADYFEYDRDGNERREDFRYHDQHHVDWMIKCLSEDVK